MFSPLPSAGGLPSGGMLVGATSLSRGVRSGSDLVDSALQWTAFAKTCGDLLPKSPVPRHDPTDSGFFPSLQSVPSLLPIGVA